MISSLVRVSSSLTLAVLAAAPLAARARGDLGRVQHVVVLVQENHSFDNYFGALPYVPGGPYHAGPCARNDHACVDGLSCSRSSTGALGCTNANPDEESSTTSFHSRNYCPGPDLRHDWPASHQEANFDNPALTFLASPNDGFARVNDRVPESIFPTILDGGGGQPDAAPGGESSTEDDTMGFYDEGDLPFYYALAQTFAMSDRYFSSTIGPTFPNRSYLLAATSFGHLTTLEIVPPLPGGYRPITGTIMDLLDRAGVSWTNFVSDVPTTAIFRGLDPSHLAPVTDFLAIAASPTCPLPAVSFVDPAFGDNTFGTNPFHVQFDEHPPTDIRAGQFFVSQIAQALRASPCWQDSVLFITYDEHGGFYDHVAPPPAKQGGRRTPDGIAPGQCADVSTPPASEAPGGGAQCDASRLDAAAICAGFTPTGAYPFWCASFDQLGFRVPFMAVSPFSRPHHVSHDVADHTSLLAFIEKRFLSTGDDDRPALTARDRHASTLEDLFDFERAPSANAPVPGAPAPSASDPGCPFVPPAP